MARATVKSIALLLLLTVLFYWKLLLSTQFTVFADTESVHCIYAWLHFYTASIQSGSLPLWDPYTFSGQSFAGLMQTGALYPLHLLMALVPLSRDPNVLAKVYECWYVLAHFLGACFMFALIREFGLSRIAALVSSLAFGLGGYLSIAAWPLFYQSASWMPLVLLFLLRALRTDAARPAVLNAAICGAALGLATLAGGFHVVIMEAIIVVTAAIFAAFHRTGPRRWTIPAIAVGTIALVAFCASAIQLFATWEYSRVTLRWLGASGALPPSQKIPYAFLTDGYYYWPQGILGLLIPKAFGGAPHGASLGKIAVMPVYLGVFPLIAAVVGIWKCWGQPWVRYLTGLAAAGFLYALGPLSLLHGLAYALIPGIWTSREADRFIFGPYFALAVLAAFGVDALLKERSWWASFKYVLLGIIVVCTLFLLTPAVFDQPAITPMVSLSLLIIAASCGLTLFLIHRAAGIVAKSLVVALILFDLAAFCSPAVNTIEATRDGTYELGRLLSMKGAARFIKSQPGLFRVQVLAEPRPNPGDVFEIQTLLGASASMVKDYFEIHPRADLLNARYIIRPASAPEPGAIYQDTAWKVYDNPTAYPRAWIVHETAAGNLDQTTVDLRKVAVLAAPLSVDLDPAAPGAAEDANVTNWEQNRVALRVRAEGRALLVLSETYYAGWQATVNGKRARIHKVDGDLRGVIVPPGDSQVVFTYSPWWLLPGGLLTLITFAGVFAAAIAFRARGRSLETPAG